MRSDESWLPRLMPAQRRLPLCVKLVFTGFLAILVPIYWREYGPTNFLYFCDAALFFTLAALWLENPLLASAPLVGIFLPQMLWVLDFLVELCGGRLTGMTEYMFKPPRFLRMLSLFHGWLPFFLVWVVWRLGYDRRAFALWTVVAWILMGICYVGMPGPTTTPRWPDQPVNINYVFGMSSEQPQQWMDSDSYFAILVALGPLVLFLPAHLLFDLLFGHKSAPKERTWAAST